VTEVDTSDVRHWSDIDFQKESGGYVCFAIKQPSTDIHIIRRIGTDSGSGDITISIKSFYLHIRT
jgi:hypothetical protein